ncbi:MAG: glutamate formiminotransferase [Thermoleophilia bacterium]|nr:glutamate formiminotransferase [Thermoleophilia bacterium]
MSLLAVPNLSEGRDFAVLDRLQDSLGTEVALLDLHTDLDHNRAVFTVAGSPEELERSMPALAGAASREIDMPDWSGLHPAIGALDVCPIVWTAERDREPARRCARTVAAGIGEIGIPVFLYGELAGSPERNERAWFRSGGLDRLWERMVAGELTPDFGPDRPHPRAGAVLVTARPPLAAFNLELDCDDLDLAREIAAGIREGGGPSALPGVRAIGLMLSTGRAQVSANVHDPLTVPLARVVEAVRGPAEEAGTRVVAAELVGLVPERALEGYPEDMPIRDFDPALRVIERRLRQG